MPKVVFTPNLERYLEVPSAAVTGATVGEALELVFSENPKLRGYIMDDQGVLRQHVMVFVDGEQDEDRQGLTDIVTSDGEILMLAVISPCIL